VLDFMPRGGGSGWEGSVLMMKGERKKEKGRTDDDRYPHLLENPRPHPHAMTRIGRGSERTAELVNGR